MTIIKYFVSNYKTKAKYKKEKGMEAAKLKTEVFILVFEYLGVTIEWYCYVWKCNYVKIEYL